MSYPNTYYKQTIAETNVRPALSGMVECDSVIIGGGLAGLTTALQLARAGQSVIVLEAESVGFGASGRNGGFVSPGFATGSDNIARMAGTEAARQIHRLSIEGVEFVRETIETLKIEEARPQPGITSVLRYDEGDSLKTHADEMRRIYGYELDYLSTDEVRSVLKSNRYFHALRDRKAFHMHPLNYLRGLAREIERLGGRIYEGSAATGSVLDSAEKTVSTSGGSVRARHVVFDHRRLHGSFERTAETFVPADRDLCHAERGSAGNSSVPPSPPRTRSSTTAAPATTIASSKAGNAYFGAGASPPARPRRSLGRGTAARNGWDLSAAQGSEDRARLVGTDVPMRATSCHKTERCKPEYGIARPLRSRAEHNRHRRKAGGRRHSGSVDRYQAVQALRARLGRRAMPGWRVAQLTYWKLQLKTGGASRGPECRREPNDRSYDSDVSGCSAAQPGRSPARADNPDDLSLV